VDWRQAEKIGLDSERIGVAHIGVGGKRHCRIEMGAVPTHAAVDCLKKLGVRVIADAVLFSGVMLGGVKRAEGQDDGKSAYEFRAVLRGVAHQAVGGASQIFAPFYDGLVSERGGNPGGIAARVVRDIDFLAAGEVHGAWTDEIHQSAKPRESPRQVPTRRIHACRGLDPETIPMRSCLVLQRGRRDLWHAPQGDTTCAA